MSSSIEGISAAGPPTLDHVIGQKQAVEQLRVALSAYWNDHSIGKSPSFGSVLMVGPKGTGKTMMARIIAAELGATLSETLGQSLSADQSLHGMLMEATDDIRLRHLIGDAQDAGAVGDFLAEVDAATEFVADDAHDIIRMRVVLGEDDRLRDFLAPWVDVGEQLVAKGLGDRANLIFGDDSAVQLVAGVDQIIVELFLPRGAGLATAFADVEPGIVEIKGLIRCGIPLSEAR